MKNIYVILILLILILSVILFFLSFDKKQKKDKKEQKEQRVLEEKTTSKTEEDIKDIKDSVDEIKEFTADQKDIQEGTNTQVDKIISGMFSPLPEFLDIITAIYKNRNNKQLDKATKTEIIIEISAMIGITALTIGLNIAGFGLIGTTISTSLSTVLKGIIPSIPKKYDGNIIDKNVLSTNIKNIITENEIDLCNSVLQSSLYFLSHEYLYKKLQGFGLANSICDTISQDKNIQNDFNKKCVENEKYNQTLIKNINNISNTHSRDFLLNLLNNSMQNLFYGDHGFIWIENAFNKTNDIRLCIELFKAYKFATQVEISYYQECAIIDNSTEQIEGVKYIINPYKSSYIGDINLEINQQTKGLLNTLKDRNQKIFDMVKKLCNLYYNNLKWYERCPTSSYYCTEHNYIQCKDDDEMKRCTYSPEYYLVDTNNIINFDDENHDGKYNEETQSDKRSENGDYFKLKSKNEINDFIVANESSGGQKCSNMLKFLEFLGLLKIKDNNYIENEHNPINIFNKICGIKFLKGQKEYFDKIDIDKYFYIGQLVYYDSYGIYQIIKYNNNKVDIKNNEIKFYNIDKSNIKPFYFYNGQIIKNKTNNNNYDIIDFHLSKFLSDQDLKTDIIISTYNLTNIIKPVIEDFLIEKNKIQYDGKTTCIIDKITESGSTKKYILVYDKIDVNISEIDTVNVYYYVGQDVIFNNVKYKIKKIDSNKVTIKSSIFTSSKIVKKSEIKFFIYKDEIITYNLLKYKIILIKKDIVTLQPLSDDKSKITFTTQDTSKFSIIPYVNMLIKNSKKIYKIVNIKNSVPNNFDFECIENIRDKINIKLQDLYTNYELELKNKSFYKFYIESSGINTELNDIEYSNNTLVFGNNKPSFEDAKDIFKNTDPIKDPEKIYKYNEYCSPIIYSDDIQLNKNNKICTNLTNEIKFNSFKNMFNDKKTDITCPSDGNYGYMNCLSPNLNPGKINDLDYKNTYSFCVLNTDNGSLYSDLIDCNDQNIKNNYDITNFIHKLNGDDDKKYILELGIYRIPIQTSTTYQPSSSTTYQPIINQNGEIMSSKIIEKTNEYNIKTETIFDGNNLNIKLLGDSNKQDIAKDINHIFKVFPTYLLIDINSITTIKCEKIKV